MSIQNMRPISSDYFNMGQAEDFIKTKLTKQKDKTVFSVTISVAKICSIQIAKGASLGAGAGVAYKVVGIAINVLIFRNAEALAKELCKQVVKAGAQMAAMAGAAAGATAAYNQIKGEYTFHIDFQKVLQFEERNERIKSIFQAFLEYRNFIDPNASVDIKDSISCNAFVIPIKTPCNHYLEMKSLLEWLNTKTAIICPICRTNLNKDALNYSWNTNFKIIKTMRAMLKDIEQASQKNCLPSERIELPESLREEDIEDLKASVLPLKKYTDDWLNLIELRGIEALYQELQAQKIDKEEHAQALFNLHEWKKNY